MYSKIKKLLSSLTLKDIAFCMIILVLIVGIYVRIDGLSTHATHVDDIGVAVDILQSDKLIEHLKNYINHEDNESYNQLLVYKVLRLIDNVGLLEDRTISLQSLSKFVIIPLKWTYAPIQFFITSILIDENQTYNQLLFWGRLPSAIFSIASLFLIILFYKKFLKTKSLKGDTVAFALISVVLLALSWENIIYAKQMENYSIGIFSIIIILILLVNYINNKGIKQNHKKNIKQKIFYFPKELLKLTIILSILTYTQYQILLFIPPFYFTIFLFSFNNLENIKDKLILVKYFFLSSTMYLILVSPVTIISQCLSKMAVHWNAGPSMEYLFKLEPGTSFINKISQSLIFYIKNSIIVFSDHLAVIPEDHIFFIPISILLLLFIILGIFSFFNTKHSTKRYLGLFFLINAVIWCGLIALKRFPLSPTRHTLILLPFLIITIAFGIHFICINISKYTKKDRKNLHITLNIIIAGFIILLFLSAYPAMNEKRTDKFQEDEIIRVLDHYHVDSIICYNFTWNLLLMKDITNKYEFIKDLPFGSKLLKTWQEETEFKNIAYISQRTDLDMMDIISTIPMMNITNPKDYKIAYSKKIYSYTTSEFSNRTLNGYNGLFFYILQER